MSEQAIREIALAAIFGLGVVVAVGVAIVAWSVNWMEDEEDDDEIQRLD